VSIVIVQSGRQSVADASFPGSAHALVAPAIITAITSVRHEHRVGVVAVILIAANQVCRCPNSESEDTLPALSPLII
jgi:hypothetical protein